jgi:hypothetical protein
LDEISGIESAQRRMMVSEYIEHLVEMQKFLYSKANAVQDNYIKRRVKLPHGGTAKISEFAVGNWVLAEWLGLQAGTRRPSKLDP